MAFDRENLKALFIQMCGKEMIRYISPDMETPVHCLYSKFFRILHESNLPIIHEAEFLKEINSFNVVYIDLLTGQWKLIIPEKEIDDRPIAEKFDFDKKIKKFIRDQNSAMNKSTLNKLVDGLKKAKDAFLKRESDTDLDNQRTNN